jgi:hypothetical protein
LEHLGEYTADYLNSLLDQQEQLERMGVNPVSSGMAIIIPKTPIYSLVPNTFQVVGGVGITPESFGSNLNTGERIICGVNALADVALVLGMIGLESEIRKAAAEGLTSKVVKDAFITRMANIAKSLGYGPRLEIIARQEIELQLLQRRLTANMSQAFPEKMRQVFLLPPEERCLLVFDPSSGRIAIGRKMHADLAERLGKTTGLAGGGIERVSEGVYRITSRTSSVGDIGCYEFRELQKAFAAAGLRLE